MRKDVNRWICASSFPLTAHQLFCLPPNPQTPFLQNTVYAGKWELSSGLTVGLRVFSLYFVCDWRHKRKSFVWFVDCSPSNWWKASTTKAPGSLSSAFDVLYSIYQGVPREIALFYAFDFASRIIIPLLYRLNYLMDCLRLQIFMAK